MPTSNNSWVASTGLNQFSLAINDLIQTFGRWNIEGSRDQSCTQNNGIEWDQPVPENYTEPICADPNCSLCNPQYASPRTASLPFRAEWTRNVARAASPRDISRASNAWFNGLSATTGEDMPAHENMGGSYPLWWDDLWHSKYTSIEDVLSTMEKRIAVSAES